ncbi:MAG: hypothetical protein ABW220_11950 [Burkholderiaceae bacterium]
MNTRCTPGVALLLLALAAAPAAAIADAPGPVVKVAPKPLAMIRAAKKPNGSGVDLQYVLEGTPRAGQDTAVTLRIDGVTDPAGALVRFTADAGLTLTGAADLRAPAGEVTTLTVQARPANDGVAYLNVFTTQNGVTSATSIPVAVGKGTPTMRSTGDLRKTPAGEPVISMPAR